MWFTLLMDAVDFSYRAYMRACSKFRPHRVGVTYFNCNVNCDIRDFIQRRVYFFNIYEPNLSYYMTDRIPHGAAVIDIGANIGYVTMLASRLVGRDGVVYSIEAAPKTFAKLSANLKLNDIGNVKAFNLAATGTDCIVEIVEGDSRNIGTNAIRDTTASTSSTIVGRPPSGVAAPHIAEVSFIKIDVEGSEGPIIEDIIDHISSFKKLNTVVSELGPGSAQYVERFQRAGFRAYALPNNYRIGATLVRKYLDRSREGGFRHENTGYVLRPVVHGLRVRARRHHAESPPRHARYTGFAVGGLRGRATGS